MVTWETIGRSVFAGKVEMALTCALISSSALALSASISNSTATLHCPSAAVVLTFTIFSMPSMDSSIRVQTPVSTSAGAAPK